MSVRKLTAKLIATLALSVLAQSATVRNAQAQMPGGPSPSIDNSVHNLPPVDPFAFDPDFRWFEPLYDADIIDMKPKKRANTGWFATYDRVFLYGTRAERFENVSDFGETKMDEGSGHRYEIGYMLPQKDTGWMFNYLDNDVYQNVGVRQERLNRFNANDLATINGTPTGNIAPPFGLTIPPSDRNERGEYYNYYDIRNNSNVVDFDSYELNKTWRLEPYHYGGILEPMVGFRWLRLDDTLYRENYTSTQSINDPLFPPITVPTFGAGELLESTQILTENEMITAQLGFRYLKHKGRFLYSGDFRVFAGQNFQCSTQVTRNELTIYDFQNNAVTIGQDPLAVQNTVTTPEYERNDEFVVGFDARGELGYQLTKAINLRAGFQLIDIARGVWRHGDEGFDDQDYLVFGGTFGITLNR